MEPFDEHLDDSDVSLSLAERLPDYAAVFGVGLAACIAVGLLVWAISDVSLASSIGYTVIMYGVVFMLAGGASGGGYTNLGVGAMGAMFGTRRADEAQEELGESWTGKARVDPRERLRRGLRPEANPRAFWQVMGGIAYILLGLAIVVPFS